MKWLIFILCLSTNLSVSAQDTWQGLVVAPEYRCSPYNKSAQYPYPQSVEDRIVSSMGGQVYGPYSGQYFVSDKETDIEHIVAASEGHDSGLCSASSLKRKQFATDLLNLTLASPAVNRCGAKGKCGLDAAEWLPAVNKCWFANRVVQIKTKYTLSVDKAEAHALSTILAECESTDLIYFSKADHNIINTPAPDSNNTLEMYDDNNNGRISCAEARNHKISPVRRNHTAYEFMDDRNNDGVVCE